MIDGLKVWNKWGPISGSPLVNVSRVKCIKVTYTKLYAVCWTLLDYVKLADFAKLQKNVAAVPFTKTRGWSPFGRQIYGFSGILPVFPELFRIFFWNYWIFMCPGEPASQELSFDRSQANFWIFRFFHIFSGFPFSGFPGSGIRIFIMLTWTSCPRALKWAVTWFFPDFPVFPDFRIRNPETRISPGPGVILGSSRIQRYPICIGLFRWSHS